MKITTVLTFSLTIVTILLSACATNLTEAGSKVRLLTSGEQASHCQVIKVITAGDNTGSDDLGNATKKALNQAVADGANAFLVISTSQDALNGASVVGNALICK